MPSPPRSILRFLTTPTRGNADGRFVWRRRRLKSAGTASRSARRRERRGFQRNAPERWWRGWVTANEHRDEEFAWVAMSTEAVPVPVKPEPTLRYFLPLAPPVPYGFWGKVTYEYKDGKAVQARVEMVLTQ